MAGIFAALPQGLADNGTPPPDYRVREPSVMAIFVCNTLIIKYIVCEEKPLKLSAEGFNLV